MDESQILLDLPIAVHVAAICFAVCVAWGQSEDDEDRGSQMSKHYDMTTKILVNDRPARLRIAEECGIGFELSSLVPRVPNFASLVGSNEFAQLTELEGLDLWI